ncbi:MAG: division/cell wall cluster transcriptional repressor MraZ [Terriglobia bacterium]
MFRGMHAATVDVKGRLKIPTAFKALLDEKYGPDCYVTSLDGQCARVYPLVEWLKVEEKLAQLPSMNKAKRKFLDRANYWGQVTRMDNQGRILIPPQLRESAGMRGQVAVMGDLVYLEVWNAQRFAEHMEQNPLTEEDEATLSGLDI